MGQGKKKIDGHYHGMKTHLSKNFMLLLLTSVMFGGWLDKDLHADLRAVPTAAEGQDEVTAERVIC